MAVKKVSHVFDKQQAMEIAILEDSHGRRHQVQIAILQDKCPHCQRPYEGDAPDPDKIIEQAAAQIASDEAKIGAHISERFKVVPVGEALVRKEDL